MIAVDPRKKCTDIYHWMWAKILRMILGQSSEDLNNFFSQKNESLSVKNALTELMLHKQLKSFHGK